MQVALSELANEPTLNAEFERYWSEAKGWRQHHAKAPPTPNAIRERELLPGEVLTWWARLVGIQNATDEKVSQWLNQALEQSPASAEVNFWYGRNLALLGDFRKAEPYLKRAAEDEGNGSYQLALVLLYLNDSTRSLAGHDESLSRAVQALRRVAETSDELHTLAVHDLLRNNPDQAVDLALRAAGLQPDCWTCLHTAAACSFAVGDRDGAVRLQRLAWLRLPEEASGEQLAQVERALSYYEKPSESATSQAKLELFLPR
jgi:tetratricopeptide (TPR) repeat protein